MTIPAGYVELSGIRQDYRDRLLTVSGMLESAESYQEIKNRSPIHLQFAIGTPESNALGDRQKAHILTEHSMRVLYAYELAAAAEGARQASVDAMTDLERSVIRAILAAPAVPPQYYQTTKWTTTARTAGGPTWIWTELTFTAVHSLPLS